MNILSSQLNFVLPEIFIASMALVILILGLYIDQKKAGNVCCYQLSILTLLVTAAFIAFNFPLDDASLLHNMVISNPMTELMKVVISVVGATTLIYGRQYNIERDIFKYEYYVLALFSICGMFIIVSGKNLLSLYLGLELMSLCMYAMIAFHRDNKLAVEAAMKYFVLGALASSILLFGMSLLYGLSGSLDLAIIAQNLQTDNQDNLALALAVVFIIVAVSFKLGAAPFHMWLPDVYHGAPTSTTIFVSAAPKIAAFALMFRLLVDGLENQHDMWQQILILLALFSVMLGNIVAIAQTNLKRMLAYSSISHMGFFLFGILCGTKIGYSASLFYVIIYSVMSAAGFGIVLYLSTRSSESDNLSDLKGLSKRSPWTAVLILILMFSMAGVPPTIGFFAKLSVIQALISASLVWVAVFAVLLAVIGTFYYLRIVKLVYFDEPEDSSPIIHPSRSFRFILSINVMILVLILPWVGWLLELTRSVFY